MPDPILLATAARLEFVSDGSVESRGFSATLSRQVRGTGRAWDGNGVDPDARIEAEVRALPSPTSAATKTMHAPENSSMPLSLIGAALPAGAAAAVAALVAAAFFYAKRRRGKASVSQTPTLVRVVPVQQASHLISLARPEDLLRTHSS